MSKQRIQISLFSVLCALALLGAPQVSAQSSAEVSPGVTPNSFLYFFDTFFENVSLALTRNPEEKAREKYEISLEKLAEIELMTEEQDSRATEKAANRFAQLVRDADNILLEASESGELVDEDLDIEIATRSAHSTEVLLRVLEKVPEQAKPAIQRAIEAPSRRGHDASKSAKIDDVNDDETDDLDENEDDSESQFEMEKVKEEKEKTNSSSHNRQGSKRKE